MPDPLTPQRLRELREMLKRCEIQVWPDRHVHRKRLAEVLLTEAEALLDAAEERVALREESIAAWATGGACARALGDDVKPSEAPERIRELIAERAAVTERLQTIAEMHRETDLIRLCNLVDSELTGRARWCERMESELDRLRERVRELEARHRLYHTCIVCHCSLDEEQDQLPYCFDCHPTDDHMCDWDDAMRLADAGDFVKAAALVGGEEE